MRACMLSASVLDQCSHMRMRAHLICCRCSMDSRALCATQCADLLVCTLDAACRHPNVRIEAHKVYNEYIQDKQHIHMNATKWITLSEYVKYLGREGFCTVEESPKGWFIRYVHRDVQQVCFHAHACGEAIHCKRTLTQFTCSSSRHHAGQSACD